MGKNEMKKRNELNLNNELKSDNMNYKYNKVKQNELGLTVKME